MPLLAPVLVQAAAGLGASAAVAAVPPKIGGEEALAGDGEAECSMDEDLDLHRCRRRNDGNLVQCQFACQHGPLKAEFVQHPHARRIVDRHLGRGVQGEGRKMVAHQPGYGQVLNDHAVSPHYRQGRQCLHQLGEFLFLYQGVQGDVDPPVMGMGVGQHPLHLGQGEVPGAGAGGEILQPGVDRIGPLLDGGEEGFQRSGRGQEFGFYR